MRREKNWIPMTYEVEEKEEARKENNLSNETIV